MASFRKRRKRLLVVESKFTEDHLRQLGVELADAAKAEALAVDQLKAMRKSLRLATAALAREEAKAKAAKAGVLQLKRKAGSLASDLSKIAVALSSLRGEQKRHSAGLGRLKRLSTMAATEAGALGATVAEKAVQVSGLEARHRALCAHPVLCDPLHAASLRLRKEQQAEVASIGELHSREW